MPTEGTERVEKLGQYHWRVGKTEYRLTDIPSDSCYECGAEIPESSYCYFREGQMSDGTIDHICWDCGHEVTGFGTHDSNGQPFSDGGIAVDPDAPFPDTIEGTLDELEEFKGTEPRELSAEAFDRRWDLRSHLLDLIREDLDESEISEATHIWWNDEAEFHLYCGGHYRPIADEQWSGFTSHPEPGEVRRAAQERLEAGALCEKCHSEAIYRRRDELFAERGIGDQDGDDDE